MLDPRLHRLLAQARVDELRAPAVPRPRIPRRPVSEDRRWLAETITLRYGFPDDAQPVARLAALDSAEVPPAPILLAEVAGELRAALSLVDGSVIAHPFYPTRTLVDLLGARARQLQQAESPAGRARVRWWGRLRLSATR